jgi:RCC1 and BTB domain-containing protein
MSTISEKYKPLKELSEELLKNIKIFFVFGIEGSEALIVTNDDKVYAIGQNSNGLLGLGHEKPIKEPTVVNELCNKGINSFSYGLSHVIGLSYMRAVYCWGKNQFGQQGSGQINIEFNKPEINECLGNKIVDVCCGAYHSLALSQTGRVYAWGRNNYGQIGDGSDVLMHSKTVEVLGFDDEKVIAISCGLNHSMALTESGRVYSWGNNECGQLGFEYNEGLIDEYKEKFKGTNSPKLVEVKDNNGVNVVIQKISCGQFHSLLLSSDGHIYGFGWNLYKQVCSKSFKIQNIPFKIEYSDKIIDIATHSGYNISCALTVNGIHLVWGECGEEVITTPFETKFKSFDEIFANYYGITYKRIDVFNGSDENSEIKNSLENNSEELDASEEKVIKIDHLLKENNLENKIEKFDSMNNSSPVESQQNDMKNNNEIKEIKYPVKTNICAKYKVLNALKEEFLNNIKTFFIFGTDNKEVYFVTNEDKFYAFGKRDTKFSDSPQTEPEEEKPEIVDELCGKEIVHFTNGFNHVIAWNENQEIYCWGNNKFGQLGNKTLSNRSSRPEIIEYLKNKKIIDIKCGSNHSLALSNNGEVYAWGDNTYGQIGNKCDYSHQLKPIKLDGFDGEKVVAISCGSRHSMALTEEGHIYSWGCNEFGQLGIDKSSELFRKLKISNEPKLVKVKDKDKNRILFEKISCGKSHSLMLSRDGNIYVIGNNEFGQLGIGINKNQRIPVKLYNKNNFVDIESNFNYDISIALSVDGVYFIGGKFDNQTINFPKETKFKSFDEIFENFFQITYRAINIKK